MKKAKYCVPAAILIFTLTVPAYQVPAQTTTVNPNIFDTTGFPQWAKDLRRWEIVAFGTFPFTMFATTFAMDTRRWIDQNGMDFSDDGRRYAPWPLKSAGAIDMSNKEHETTLLIAAGISVALAFADLVIVQIKRQKERRRVERMPTGSVIIEKSPWPEEDAAGRVEPGGADPEAGEPAEGEVLPEAPAAP
jgi:hypothetical protein